MEPIVLPSGAKLEITLLPWEEAWGVSQRVAKVFEGLPIDGESLKMDAKSFLLADVAKIKGPLLFLVGNQVIVEAAKTCFKRCTYNGLRIDKDTFEAREARQDYIPAVIQVLRENIAPFFESLISSLGMK